VWFFVSHADGVRQECLTGIVVGCTVISGGRKDGEPNDIYTIQVRQVYWQVDASRVFEYWEDCDREARIFEKWNKELRNGNAD